MLYWSDEESAKLFNNLYESALAYGAEHTGSFASFFSVYGRKPTMTTPEEMSEAVEALRKPFAAVEGYRGIYLRDMLKAVETFVALLKGENISYQEAIWSILGFEIREISPERQNRVERKIDEFLTADGYLQAKTSEKVRQWYKDNGLSPEELPNTARQYLQILQREMHKIVDAPKEEGWGKLELVQGVSWGAFSQYCGRYVTNMLMNRDSIWKRPTFIDTISHELYPGHHTWYSMREKYFYEDEVPLEAATLGICSAENLLFEGIPESGAHFIGIDDPDREIEGIDRELRHKIMMARMILEYVRILEVNACYHYHVEHWTKEQLVKDLTKDGWIEIPVAERTFTYYGHPLNGLYYPSYYYGRWLVTYAYDLFPEEKKADFFKMLYKEPHSTGSFIKRIQEMTGKPFDPIGMALE